jgi:predicted acetyltransferase
MRPDQNTRANLQVVPAALEQEPLLANLLELYCHDMSEFIDLELRADGRFHYPWLRHYWQEEGRYPYLVRVDGQPAGVVLVSRGSRISGDADVWDMAEFFIVRKYRRLGLGRQAARLVWSERPGKWEVRVLVQNAPAVRFWEAATGGCSATRTQVTSAEAPEKRWHVFSFRSGASAQPG